MGSLWRSEEMQLVQLFLQIDAAHDTVAELGELGQIQFRDLCPNVSAFQRNFVNDVKRCDELERKVRFFEDMVERERKEAEELAGDDAEFVGLDDDNDDRAQPSGPFKIDALETAFDDIEKDLIQMNDNQEKLTRNYNELIEFKHVLQKDAAFFYEDGGSGLVVEEGESRSLLGEGAGRGDPDAGLGRAIKLGFVTGTINREAFSSFERVLWRATRGNLFMRHAEIETVLKDPTSGNLVEKNVFIIFYQGELAQTKIKKICESYAANLYPCPETSSEREKLLADTEDRIEDLQTVLARTGKHRTQVLRDVGQNIKAWNEFVVKEKSIFHTMNLFNYDVGRKCLIAEGWTPKRSTERVVNAMRRATESSGADVPSILSVIKSKEEPPTHFETNKFTRSFQGMVEAYGVARYGEVNPAVFTIMSFPFLFGVMFGDLGHGFIMFLFALFMCIKEKDLEKSIPKDFMTVYSGRYLILCMSIFSMYCGALYNEAFAIAMDFGGSQWDFPKPCCAWEWEEDGKFPDWCIAPVGTEKDFNCTIPIREGFMKNNSNTYLFGVDPAWKGASNTLAYYNSLKMKLSVILGVGQMTLGIILSLFNGLHYRQAVDIYGEFVPQIIFLVGLFGYMDFLIFLKWLTPINEGEKPMIINLMIDMFLKPYTLPDQDVLYSGQYPVQLILLLLALVAVPWMLCTKPFVLKSQFKQRQRLLPPSVAMADSDSDSDGRADSDDEAEEFDFGEIFVHQIIHTIEFVLGAVSNTASYLRLWALSLAHAELSEVFWDRVFLAAFNYDVSFGGIGVVAFGGFAMWAGATTGVLLLMESLSAFLHALRLHWVEFQNKFYHGDGRKFVPFDFGKILAGEDDD